MDKKKKKRLISILVCVCVIALGLTYLIFYARKRGKEKSMTDAVVISKSLKQGDKYLVGLSKQIEEEINSDTTSTLEGVELSMTISEMYPYFKSSYIEFYVFDYLVNNVSVKNGYDSKFNYDKLYYQDINLISLGVETGCYTQYLKAKESDDGLSLNAYIFEGDELSNFMKMDIEYDYKHDKPLSLNLFQIAIVDETLSVNTFNVYFEETIAVFQNYQMNCTYNNLLDIKTSDDAILSVLKSGKYFKGGYNEDNKYRLAENTCIKFSDTNWTLDEENFATKELILSSIKNINYVKKSALKVNKEKAQECNFLIDATTYPSIIFQEIEKSVDEIVTFEIHKGGFNNYDLITNANVIIDSAEKDTGFNELKEFLDSKKYKTSKIYADDITYGDYVFERTFFNDKNLILRNIHSTDEKILSTFTIMSVDGINPYQIKFGKIRKHDGKIYMTWFEQTGSISSTQTCVFANITLSEIYEILSESDNSDNLTDVWSDYESYVESSSANCDVSSVVLNLYNSGIIKK
ncbi:MAG: hypothetical protein IJ008_00400 [Clostridia bacterium]|nr:hypothetical protein [Clostridia bacterium]